MTHIAQRWLVVGALCAALAAGFGLGRLTGEAAHGTDEPGHDAPSGARHTSAHGDDGHAREDGKAHEAGEHAERGEDEDHAGHGGEGVEEGVVALTARQIEAAGITVVAVGRGAGSETRLVGRVVSAPGARSAVAASVAGRVERVLVAAGSPVRANQTLAVIASGEAASLRAGADAAAAEADAARLAYQRDAALVEQGVVARQALEASRARSLAADATARAARAQVAAAGSPDAQGRIAVVSPVAGVVGSVPVTPGGFVAAGGIVAEVADPARTELVFSAPPALAAHVSAGDRIDAQGPAGSLPAMVLGVSADVREQGAAAIIRARAASGSLPPAGSAMTATLLTRRADDALSVPADAVQTVAGRSVVFVEAAGGFRATPVLAGRRAGSHIEILDGLDAGARVAGTNAFLLKAELAKGEAGHEH